MSHETPVPKLNELRKACCMRLLASARALDAGGAAMGVPVFLERGEKASQPKLITTAEAVWALASVPKELLREDALSPLINGLELLWKSDAKDNPPNPRHLAWYLLALTSVGDNKKAKQVVEVANSLMRLQKQGGFWEDDIERGHEIYASWICTWSLLLAYEFLGELGAQFNSSHKEIRQVVEEKLELFKDIIAQNPSGLPFSTGKQKTLQIDESEPNPAMTAYVLVLCGEAARVFQSPKHVKRNEALYDYLIRQANKARGWVWDSYREPQLPNSSQSEFEHFTTCWVARALWMALTWGNGIDESVKRKWFLSFAHALRGLVMSLRVEGREREGQFFVDRGSPRDFSFAVSDMLGFLNLLTKWSINFPSDEDWKLEQLVMLGEIESLFVDAAEEQRLERRFTHLVAVEKSLEEAQQQSFEAIERHRKELSELERLLGQKREELGQVELAKRKIEESIADKVMHVELKSGLRLGPVLMTNLELFMFVVGGLAVALRLAVCIFASYWPGHDELLKNLGLSISFLGLACSGFLFGGLLAEAMRERRIRRRNLVPLFLCLASLFWVLTFVEDYLKLLLMGHEFDIVTLLGTLAVVPGAPIGGYKQHEAAWRKCCSSKPLAAADGSDE